MGRSSRFPGWSQQARLIIPTIKRRAVAPPAGAATTATAGLTGTATPASAAGATAVPAAPSATPAVVVAAAPAPVLSGPALEFHVFPDEYDPSKPNDYETLRDRTRALQASSMTPGFHAHPPAPASAPDLRHARGRDSDDDLAAPNVAPAALATAALADAQTGEEAFAARASLSRAPAAITISGEEAYLARGRLSGGGPAAAPPAPTVAAAVAAGPTAPTAPALPSGDGMGRGERMMARMGWKAGQGAVPHGAGSGNGGREEEVGERQAIRRPADVRPRLAIHALPSRDVCA